MRTFKQWLEQLDSEPISVPRDMQPDMVGGAAPGLPKVKSKLPKWKKDLSPNQEKKNQGYNL